MSVPTISVEAEQGVLGVLMMSPGAWDRVSDILRPDHFCRDDHRAIFREIVAALDRNGPTDPVAINSALEVSGESEQCGGLAYLGDLAVAAFSAATVRRHAETIVERATLRALLSAAEEIVDVVHKPDSSVAEKLDAAQGALQKAAEGSVSVREPVAIQVAITRFVDELERRFDGDNRGAVSTGFVDLDKALNGGLRPGQLVIVAARPGMGKSALALQIADACPAPALVLSQEMSEDDVVGRIFSARGRVALESLVSGQMAPSDWEMVTFALGHLQNHGNLWIDDQPALKLSDVRSKARCVVRKKGRIGMLVIDYLQLMAGGGDGRNRNSEIEVISRGLKQLAKELGCPVVALSQLSRECEKRPNKRPMLSDLRDSGSIEQDADVVLCLYRDEEYNPDSPDAGTAEVLIRKQRQGRTGAVRLAWNGRCAAFENLDMGAWSQQREDERQRKAIEKPMIRRRQFDEA